MQHLNCDCNPPAVLSSIDGKRCHIVNERGTWCAIVNENGIYLQTLVVPSADEIIKDQAHQEKIQAEQAAEIAKETRKQELKAKLDSDEILSSQELHELLKLVIS